MIDSTTQYNLVGVDNKDLNDTLFISEVLKGTATGAAGGGGYTSVTTLRYKGGNQINPPFALAFQVDTATNTSSQIPFIALDPYPNLYFILDGLVCKSWSNIKIYTDRVEITSASVNPYTYNYVVYILTNKEGYFVRS